MDLVCWDRVAESNVALFAEEDETKEEEGDNAHCEEGNNEEEETVKLQERRVSRQIGGQKDKANPDDKKNQHKRGTEEQEERYNAKWDVECACNAGFVT